MKLLYLPQDKKSTLSVYLGLLHPPKSGKNKRSIYLKLLYPAKGGKNSFIYLKLLQTIREYMFHLHRAQSSTQGWIEQKICLSEAPSPAKGWKQ